MLVFTENTNSRLEFVAKEIAFRVGAVFQGLTTDKDYFSQHSGLKINYSNHSISNSFQVVPKGLLEEKTITPQKIEWFNCDDTPVFFRSHNGDLAYDIFSFVFFHLSRYEEYLPFESDIHNRFTAKNSIIAKEKLLQQPIVEQCCKALKIKLATHFPTYRFSERKFNSVFTFDIDNAWAFKNKSKAIKIGSSVKDVLRMNFKNISHRRKVLSGKEKDPFDTYSYIQTIIQHYKLESIFFFLLGDRTRYDKSIDWRNNELKKLIQSLQNSSKIGIHPSYSSLNNKQKVKTEIDRLKTIMNQEVVLSRQHYLRFRLPGTYQTLNDFGICEEYSMGFADEIGFRAGTCLPFYFFNLHTNSSTEMKIIPLIIMDGTLNEYMKLTVEEAKAHSQKVIQSIKDVDGLFVALWHNETLNNQSKWKNWQEVFESQVLAAIN